MKLKCIAVDDEPLALDVISKYIESLPYLEFMGRFTNSIKAMDFLKNNQIDLLFIDIQMPDLNGFQIIEELEPKPLIILTTAYGEYALDGFKVNAIDYLLKPIEFENFERSVQKARQWFVARTNIQTNKEFLYIKSGYKIIRLNFSEIEFIQGMSEYIKIHISTGKPIMSLMPLKALEEKLPSDKFMRVHKSFIVNLDKINVIERGEIYYDDGTIIPVSSQYKEAFNEYLKNNF